MLPNLNERTSSDATEPNSFGERIDGYITTWHVFQPNTLQMEFPSIFALLAQAALHSGAGLYSFALTKIGTPTVGAVR